MGITPQHLWMTGISFDGLAVGPSSKVYMVSPLTKQFTMKRAILLCILFFTFFISEVCFCSFSYFFGGW